ncbi:glycosyltransferase family 2 protein [Deinococcus alpinitundrae]|uniref:glycosyltransferase family 2 protein n=1 Tax=Deinococcus alpinitundrae TaxID=468913 RepID=UPI001379EC4B|nr:glycosyltransferase family 2 protein [Deinococcus alpinitundrae]
MILVIVTVNYGDPSDTLTLLESVLGADLDETTYFVVVDNGSTEADRNALFNGFDSVFKYIGESKNVIVIANETNLGFSGGNNVGIKYALENLNAEYVWLLNNDTTLDNMAIRKMREHISKNKKTIIGSTIVDEQSNRIQCLGGAELDKYTFTGKYVGLGMNVNDVSIMEADATAAKFDYIHGASLLIPREVLHRIGYLDERYFLYYEEVDYCLAASREGIHLTWAKDVFITHKEGSSINGGSYKKKRSSLSEYHSTRSFLLFVMKWYPRRFTTLLIIRIISKTLINIYKGRFYLIATNFKASLSVIRGGN